MLDAPEGVLRTTAAPMPDHRIDGADLVARGVIEEHAARAILPGDSGILQGRVAGFRIGHGEGRILEGAAEEVMRACDRRS